MGYNFRNSVAYRGDDDPGDTVVDGGSGSQYSGPQGWGFSIYPDTLGFYYDITTGGDPRLGGAVVTKVGGRGENFRIDLPSTGTYDITFGGGRNSYGIGNPYIRFLDDTTVLRTIDLGAAAVGDDEYVDATGVVRTSPTDWVDNNATDQQTFATTIFYVELGTTGRDAVMNHVSVDLVSGGSSSDVNFHGTGRGIFRGVGRGVG